MIPFAMMSLSEKNDLDRSQCNCLYSYKKIFSNNNRSAPRKAPLCMQLAQKPGHYHPTILKSTKYQLQSMSLLFCLSAIKGYQAFVCGNWLAMEEIHSAFKPDYPSRPIVSSHPAPPQTELPPHTWRGPALLFPPRRGCLAVAL
jgi:hypothetical protein